MHFNLNLETLKYAKTSEYEKNPLQMCLNTRNGIFSALLCRVELNLISTFVGIALFATFRMYTQYKTSRRHGILLINVNEYDFILNYL